MIAIKLSSLDIKNNISDAKKKIFTLIDLAIDNNSKILIDAENYSIQNNINNITDNVIEKYNIDKVNVYKTYQMYRIDSYNLLKSDLIKERDYNLGIKLVRGAYYNSDKKYNILHEKIEDTHNDYNRSIDLFIKNSKYLDSIICATHNKDSINYTKKLIDNDIQLKHKIEFAHLLGMSDNLSYELSKNYTVYKYLPFGNFSDTLPYLIRRLYENYPMIKHLIR